MTPTEPTTAETPPTAPPAHMTAAEILRLPWDEQEAILAAAADRAVHDYLTDPELTAFEAFGPRDLYGHSSDAQSR